MIELDLLQYQSQLQLKVLDGKRMVFDPIRKKWLILSPEELVRQLLVILLINEKGYNKNRIALEKALKVNGMLRRWDILIYNEHTEAKLLIECKAPEVNLSQKTFEQAARYNLSLKVPFLMISNGRQTYCCQIDFVEESFTFLQEIPNADELNSV